MELPILTLPNSIRVIHVPIESKVSHCGIFINAGTRDEEDEEHGMAHFIEHVIFKGTEKRNLYQVLNRLENVGADLNAYTTKEETCIYATFLNEYYDRTLELISDICFHSAFPPAELEKEKAVIIDEIRSYLDTPSEQIFDDFEDLVFANHPLGRNILGTPKNVRKFRQQHIKNFIHRNYHTDGIVICSVGNIDARKFNQLARKYFAMIPSNLSNREREQFKVYTPQNKSPKKKVFQTHCVLGTTGYPFGEEKRYTLAFLSNILGGPAMNSRLSLTLREKNGITYHIESNYLPYTDTGIFTVYFGTDRKLLEKALTLVEKELKKIRNEKLGSRQMDNARKQLIGQLAIAQESKLSQMLSMGKSFLVMNRYLSIEEIIRKIENITTEDLLETANEILAPERLSRLIYHSTN